MNGRRARLLREAARNYPHAPSRRRFYRGLKRRYAALSAQDKRRAAEKVARA